MEGRRNGGKDAVEESEGKEWTWSNADERNILIWKRIELLKKWNISQYYWMAQINSSS